METETQQILIRYRSGDESAATELFHRYVDQLIGLARSRLSASLQQRVGPDDVVQSVYRSFFKAARDGRFELKRSGDLWRLLSAITINKVLKKVEHNTQQKRDYQRETSPGSGVRPELFAVDPSDSDVVAVIDELEHVMQKLPANQRQMLELRLQDLSTYEIAEQVDCAERTVRRFLKSLEQEMVARLHFVERDGTSE